MEQWLEILLVAGGILLFVILFVIIYLCYKRYLSRSYSTLFNPLFQSTSYASSSSTSALDHPANKKMWVDGHNPTEWRIDMNGRKSKNKKENVELDGEEILSRKRREEEEETLYNSYTRICSHFCRSLIQTRILLSTLAMIGERKCKFHTFISDEKIMGDRNKETLYMCLLLPSLFQNSSSQSSNSSNSNQSSHLIDITDNKKFTLLKNLLISPQVVHPYILPLLDLSLSIDKNIFTVRQWSKEGSVRDMLYVSQPSRSYQTKYCVYDAQTHEYLVKEAEEGVRYETAQRWTKQVICALKFLESRHIPYHQLHTGNVILLNGVCHLTEIEGDFLGFKNRLHKKIKKMSQSDPVLCSLAFFIYEILVGAEIPMPRKNEVDLSELRSNQFKDAVDMIHLCLHPNHNVTYDELLIHPFVSSVNLPLAAASSTAAAAAPAALDSKTNKILISTFNYYSQNIYANFPNLVSVAPEEIVREKEREKESSSKDKKKKTKRNSTISSSPSHQQQQQAQSQHSTIREDENNFSDDPF